MQTAPPSYLDNLVRKFNDYSTGTTNTILGRRVVNNTKPAKNKIYFVGMCRTFGYCSPDDGTIPYNFAEKINNVFPSEKYEVVNMGYYVVNHYDDRGYILNSLILEKGDIVICESRADIRKSPYLEFIDLYNIFRRPHNYGEVFTDRNHFTQNGNSIIAEKIFEYCLENKIFDNYTRENVQPPKNHIQMSPNYGIPIPNFDLSVKNTFGFNDETNQQLQEYKLELQKLKPKIGSIVMNCNPFTLGHRYLIEQSAKKVEKLFIFVVEEDKSVFPFADRIELVRKGTADLTNVVVIPSGKFIISQLTFAEYSNKSSLQDKIIDPSFDVELFAEQIAPTLNITVRFAGEEPLDNVTRQYNDTMRRVLPKHGIEFEVIPRKESGGAVISASRVRKLLEDKHFDEISEIVPMTTLEYLKSNF
jgi:[citrate (pro-3S)-lyase] ligase